MVSGGEGSLSGSLCFVIISHKQFWVYYTGNYFLSFPGLKVKTSYWHPVEYHTNQSTKPIFYAGCGSGWILTGLGSRPGLILPGLGPLMNYRLLAQPDQCPPLKKCGSGSTTKSFCLTFWLLSERWWMKEMLCPRECEKCRDKQSQD